MLLDIPFLLILIPLLPLAAAVLTAALGKHVLGRASHWPTVAAVALSSAASLLLVVAVRHEPGHEKIVQLWTWATVDAVSPPPPGEAPTSGYPGVRAWRRHASTTSSFSATRPHPNPLPEGEGTLFHILEHRH